MSDQQSTNETCPVCEGLGSVSEWTDDRTYEVHDCPDCNSDGQCDPIPVDPLFVAPDCYDCASGTQRTTTMSVCTECGNKRCPKATNHRLDCTGSNEPGQPGSRYGGTSPVATNIAGDIDHIVGTLEGVSEVLLGPHGPTVQARQIGELCEELATRLRRIAAEMREAES